MTHLKRQEIPTKWPIPRKGTAYIIKPLSNLSNSLPILVALRDLLKIAQNRREVKRSIHLKQIIQNAKIINDEKTGLYLFDTISIIPLKKNYRLELSGNGKFMINEIKESEANHKISKIINKKTLNGKKVQLNLSDGRNYLSDIKCRVNDSVLVNLKEGKIEKCLPLKENSRALIIAGKHSGEKGIIKSIDNEKKMAGIESGDSHINVLIKQLIITE
jgi:small subunit ribosomal protein S4e